MKRTFLYILTIILVFSCKTENKKKNLIQKKISKNDSIIEIKKIDYSQYSKYKVSHVNDEYGKRLYIDSLHYNIIIRYYKSDSTKLYFISSSDFVNDTILRKEYYKNGNLKLIKKTTYRNFIPIGVWKYYNNNNNGELKKKKDFDNQFKIPFQKAISIAKQNGIKKPYETRIYKDSLYWEIMNWKNVKFDTITNQGIDKGKGVLINRENGKTEKIERERKWVS